MKKIKFKLQKLLDIKIKEEDESKLIYTNAQNEKRAVENNLKDLEQRYEEYSDIGRVEGAINQKITINYLTSLTQSIHMTNKKLEEKEIIVNKAKEEFINKQIKRKTLETLKENEISRIRKEEERIEQITNDEFALYAYIRNNVNAS